MAAKQQHRMAGIVADNVRRLRKQARMTQTDLANAAGISRASVAQIEGQRYSSFTLATLEGIAGALKVAPEELLKDHKAPLVPLVRKLAESPWGEALKVTSAELKLISEALPSLHCHPDMPVSLLAELAQLLRRARTAPSLDD